MQKNNLIEVNGISFETIISKRVFSLPLKQLDISIPIQLGIKVNNFSLTSYRFLFFYLLPELAEANGKEVSRSYGRNVTRFPKRSDFLLVRPQENLSFTMDGQFCRHEDKLIFKGRDNSGGIWIFANLKLGRYKIRFIYQNTENSKKLSRGEYREVIIENLWTGSVATPWIEFQLSQADNLPN